MKKVVDVVKSIISFILFIIYFCFALVMTILLLNYNDYGVTQFGEKSFILINGKISNELYKEGDLVVVESSKIEDYKVGEYIFTYRVGADRIPVVQLGKIGNVYPEEDAISFENGETYSYEFIAGKTEKVHAGIGTFLSVVESKWGFLFIVLVPCLLIFIYEVYALIVEIKYGEEEND